ncbi:hypothetical protein N0V82_007389 [Gnomoniopsis sp. IMI 355080]|nr:hypothetical protein N0V82_007389 [Gnomoniopsis sp. IMI 355080]
MLAKLPDLSGHLGLNLDPRIRPMIHDIFSSQPVLGAKVYYIHFLLHDFPDKQCRTMLRHVVRAMKPGYSRVLLNEIVVPALACPSFFAAADITIMACLAGIQRSKAQWISLVESAGLTVTKVWTSPDDDDFEGIIEATIA